MKTRNGIYYDLTKSVYRVKVPDTRTTFIFSSDLHLIKFEDNFMRNREDFNLKLTSRFRLETDFKQFPDLLLYKKIETRGFMVIDEGGQLLCQENLILKCEKVTSKD